RPMPDRAALSTAAGAAGALTPLAAELAGLGPANLISTLLYTYAGAGLLMLLTSLLVRVDAGPGLDGPALVAGELAGSKPLVKRLALLFVLDSSGSGIAANTLVVYWLHADMGFSTGQLAVLMFAVDMLSAISAPLAVAVSKRAGLLRTAVFSHIPSSILLMAIPLAPGGAAAAALLLARALLVEMDVPTRQAYMSAVVAPEERQAAAAYVSRGKQLGRATGPLVGGFSFAEIGSGVFAVGGAVKIAYDLMLWRSFRTVKMQERVGAPDGMASSRGS
ncbi:MAG: MFS transporter, partial [Actinomycetota bacterium]|nr:MFS transporter [Actinomycetota bacterium]